MKSSILPNIVEIAQNHNLTIKSRSIGKKETLCKCPFCLEDSQPRKKNKYYLSLNEDKNVFKCWYCKEYGGVVKFISLLDGKSESEIIESLRKKNGFHYQKHPAEKLSRSQLRMIGYPNINWMKNRDYDVELYKAFREKVYQKWLAFVEQQKLSAYQLIYAGIITGDFDSAVEKVEKMENELGVELLEDVLKVVSNAKRTDQVFEKEKFVVSMLKKEHPYHILQSTLI